MSHEQPTHNPANHGDLLPADADASRLASSEAGTQFEGDDINAGLLTVIGAFLAVTVFLIVVLLQAWFYNWKAGAAASQTIATTDPQTLLGRALVEQQEQLNSYHWIKREANVRAVPIERAMQLVTAEMAVQQNAAQKLRQKEGGKP